MQADIGARVREMIQRSQQVKSDPFDFGEVVRGRLPWLWQQVGEDRWAEVWAKTPVEVHPNVRLIHVERTSEPPPMRTSPPR